MWRTGGYEEGISYGAMSLLGAVLFGAAGAAIGDRRGMVIGAAVGAVLFVPIMSAVHASNSPTSQVDAAKVVKDTLPSAAGAVAGAVAGAALPALGVPVGAAVGGVLGWPLYGIAVSASEA